jgi:hypothetical protein
MTGAVDLGALVVDLIQDYEHVQVGFRLRLAAGIGTEQKESF